MSRVTHRVWLRTGAGSHMTLSGPWDRLWWQIFQVGWEGVCYLSSWHVGPEHGADLTQSSLPLACFLPFPFPAGCCPTCQMLTSRVCLLFYLLILACSWTFLFIHFSNCYKGGNVFWLIKMNKPVFNNNFNHITRKVQRNSLCRSHVLSALLLPCCAQAIPWLQSMTLSWPTVIPQSPYVTSGSHLMLWRWINRWRWMCRVGVLSRRLSLTPTPLCSACFSFTLLPHPQQLLIFSLALQSPSFPGSKWLESYRKQSCRLASFTLSHV